MYKTLYDKERIFNFIIENASYVSSILDKSMVDQNFNVYIEQNLQTKENFLRGDLVIERNSFGDAIHTLYESHRIVGDPDYYVYTSTHMLAKDVRDLYMKANSRKREKQNKAVYYICNLLSTPVRGKHVEFLYRHPAFDNKLEFVDSDNDSRCTWFYSEKDVKDFIAEARYYINYRCANPFVVKAVRVGDETKRTFYNLDLNEERYDLYGPVESCCKRLARHSRIGEDKAYDNIYISTASPGPYALANYIKRDIESTIWTQRYINNKLKEIMEEMNLPKIKKVIFNNPATIVFWADESKTIVKCENEEFDPEKGLSMAISKKALGNKHDYYNVFKKWLPKEKKEDKKPTKKNETKKSSNKKNNK